MSKLSISNNIKTDIVVNYGKIKNYHKIEIHYCLAIN